MRPCHLCGTEIGSRDRFCSGCGVRADATILTLDGVSLDGVSLDGDSLDGIGPTPAAAGGDHRSSEVGAGRRGFTTVLAVAVIGVIGVLVGTALLGGGTDAPDAAGEASAAASDDGLATSADPMRVRSPEADWFPDRRFDQWLAMVDGREVVAVELTSDRERRMELPAAVSHDRIAVVDSHLIFIGDDGHAWAVPLAGDPAIDLGAANQLRTSPIDGHIWLGDGSTAVGEETEWREQTLAGAVARHATRTTPLEFDRPDLIWGFDSSVFRLTTSPDRPWRLIADGYPVAASADDLVMNRCDHDDDAERNCERRWYRLPDGERRTDVFGDLAANIPVHYGGRVSPHQRFVYRQLREGERVTIWQLSTGDEAPVDCTASATLAWAASDEYLACETSDGIVVLETGSGRMRLMAVQSAHAWAFVDGGALG